MRRLHFGQRATFMVLVLAAACALAVLAGSQGTTGRASADTTYNPFGPTFLHASDFSPADGATGIAPNVNISVKFDRDVRPDSLTNTFLGGAGFYLRQGSSTTDVPATISYSSTTDRATLNPTTDLIPGATYHATLWRGITSVDGYNMNADITWSFTIDTPPHMVSWIPSTGATGVPVDQTIRITFDKNMRSPSGLSLRKVGGNAVGVALARSADKRTLIIQPIRDLEEGTRYEVTVTDAIKSETGISVQPAPFTWTFTTTGGAPVVTATSPAGGATGVSLDQVVSATFDRNMDAATLTSATFFLKKTGGSPLPATVVYNGETKTATLDPSAALEAGVTYSATLSAAVKSQTGQALSGAPKVWSFTTATAGTGGDDDGGDDDGGDGPSDGIVFTDVAGSPYEAAIYELAHRHVIDGYDDHTFRPTNLVLRKHFAKMIVGTMGLTVTEAAWSDTSPPFADCGPDDLADIYPHDFIAVAKTAGLTQGKTPTTFAPNDTITHQQLITMVARAAGLAAPPVGYVAHFTSAQFSTSEHFQNALKAGAAGLLDGLVGVGPTYDFLAGSTRGECAQILYNLLMLAP